MANTGHVRGILSDLLRRIEKGPGKKGNAVREAWYEVVSEEMKKHTRPVSLKKGVLVVITDNSSWLYRMTLEKRNIQRKFNESYSGKKKIKNIRFRIGTIEM